MLDFIDRELIEDFTHQLRDRGVVLRFGCKVGQDRARRRRPLRHPSGGRPRGAHGGPALCGGPRRRTDTLNLEACGLEATSRGRLVVDKSTFQTAVPHIYAAGDVIGFPSLASTSMEQGRIAACHAFDAHARTAAIFPLRHLLGAGNLHHRHERGGSASNAAFPMNAASRGSARRRAATSWASIRA